jgi:serine/threonine-protein kinase
VLQICVRDLPVPSQVADVPAGFDAWFARAVNRDPDVRFQTAREMTDALRDALGVEVRDGATPPPESVVSMSSDRIEVSLPASKRTSRPDPGAATLAIAPAVTSTLSEKRAAWAETPLPSELPPPQSGLGSVVAVAAVALGIGLGGGFWALRAHEPTPNPQPVLPPIASNPLNDDPNATSEKAGASASARPSPSASASPGPLASAAPDAVLSASASAVASAAPAAPKAGSQNPRPVEATEPSEPNPPRDLAPDGSWVKPAWAIPDDEPTRAEPVEEPDP